MFDYARLMQRAVSDIGRRVALKVVAGALGALAAGFLVAALWTFFARTLALGPLWASLIVAGIFGGIAAILFVMSNRVKHAVPPVDLLKREVEVRARLATDAALDMAKAKANEVVALAEQKAHGLVDTARFKAASLVDDVESKAHAFVHGSVDTATRKVSGTLDTAVRAVGLDGGPATQMIDLVNEVRTSRAGPAIGVLGAFAVGIALASRVGGRSDDDLWVEDYDDEFIDDDVYA